VAIVSGISRPALLLLLGLVTIGHAQDPQPDKTELSDFPFWQKMAGWWESDNTYMDAEMDYLIRAYSSLVHIQLDGRHFRETEHRFYPAGLGTSRYAGGLAGPAEGVELVVNTTGELIDASGTLGSIRVDPQVASSGPNVFYRVLSEHDGVRVNTNPETGLDTYRMYFNFTTPDRRYRSNFGLLSEDNESAGGLRAFILYRGRRIEPSTFQSRRAALRERYNVGVISAADPNTTGQFRARRLD
jgi:hypothetical protein